jgi:hypothetical protein
MATIKKKILKGIKITEYEFKKPPLVVGGLAMEYYGLRKTGHDYDYMVSKSDWVKLKKKHPKSVNLFGGKTEKDIDSTINLKTKKGKVDLINTLYQHNYKELSKGSINFKNYKIISLEKLLFIKTLDAIWKRTGKSINDSKLIVNNIVKKKYPNFKIK